MLDAIAVTVQENDHSAPKLVEAVPVKSEPVPFSLGAAQPSGEGSKPAPFAFGVPPGKTEERAPDEKLGMLSPQHQGVLLSVWQRLKPA